MKTVLQIRESIVGRSDQFGSNTSASFKHSQEEYRQNQNRLHSKSHHLNISKNNLKNVLASSRFYASSSFADPGVSGFVTQYPKTDTPCKHAWHSAPDSFSPSQSGAHLPMASFSASARNLQKASAQKAVKICLFFFFLLFASPARATCEL